MALNSWPTLRPCMTGMLVKNKVIKGQVGEQSIKGVELCSENLSFCSFASAMEIRHLKLKTSRMYLAACGFPSNP